jgi:endonuclease III
LAAVLLSAQATDVGVNKATRKLFPVANTPAGLLALGEAGLKGRDVGPVKIQEFFSLVDVPEDRARKVVKALNHCTIRGRKAKVKLDEG